MAWEWVEPVVGPLAGVLGAVVGIFGTLKATERQGEAQVRIAREERQQRRLEASYMELLTALAESRAWASHFFDEVFWETDVNELPSVPERAPKREALLTAYWSPRIQSLMAEWDAKIREVSSCGTQVALFDRARKAQREVPPHTHGAEARLLAAHEDLLPIDERIREQVRRELLGQDDGRID